MGGGSCVGVGVRLTPGRRRVGKPRLRFACGCMVGLPAMAGIPAEGASAPLHPRPVRVPGLRGTVRAGVSLVRPRAMAAEACAPGWALWPTANSQPTLCCVQSQRQHVKVGAILEATALSSGLNIDLNRYSKTIKTIALQVEKPTVFVWKNNVHTVLCY